MFNSSKVESIWFLSNIRLQTNVLLETKSLTNVLPVYPKLEPRGCVEGKEKKLSVHKSQATVYKVRWGLNVSRALMEGGSGHLEQILQHDHGNQSPARYTVKSGTVWFGRMKLQILHCLAGYRLGKIPMER